jgi:general secretion pathway protein C
MQGIRQQRWLQHWQERAPDYASFMLVILCGFLLARLVWGFIAEPRPPLAESAQTTETAAGDASPGFGEQIAGQHLFGQYTPGSTAKPVTNVQVTQLALTLKGLYSLPGNRGYAVIEENGQQNRYIPGQAIGNSGAILEQIHSDHILFRRNGLLEKLVLPPLAQSGGNSPAADMGGTMNPIPDMGGEMPADAEPPVIDDPPADLITPDAEGVPPQYQNQPPQPETEAPPAEGGTSLADFRQAVVNNNARLLEAISPQPYEKDGKMIGFQINPGSNVSLFNKLGFQQGDVVTSINGTPMNNPGSAMQIMQEASTASQINLNIIRNGQEISLPVSFQ